MQAQLDGLPRRRTAEIACDWAEVQKAVEITPEERHRDRGL
jgi:hypothetical protein